MTSKVSISTSSQVIQETNSSNSSESNIKKLPTDCLRTILNFLPKKETAAVHFVQHSWRNLQPFEIHLDLSRRLNVSDTDLKRIIDEYMKRGIKITSIDLSRALITDKSLEYIANHVPALKSLNISLCLNTTDKGLEHIVNLPLTEL